MLDPRIQTLARNLVGYSCNLQPGEKILIEAVDIPQEAVGALVRAAVERGGIPLVTLKQSAVLRELYRTATEEGMRFTGQIERARMEGVQAYIALRGNHNIAELSDVPTARMDLYEKHWWKPVHIDVRVPKTKWCVLRWPHPSMAQGAGMPTDAFEDFYFDVCCLDYKHMDAAMAPLVELMRKTDRVQITGPGTDLSFSIKGIGVVKCSGLRNIPDGEVYTAPVRDSAEGTLHYTAETLYRGTVFSDIRLTFEKGKVVKGVSSDTAKLNQILDSDEGARYIGEFALGLNPFIKKPMKDILFDEKIGGSFHFTPGNAYGQADNGNRSQVHWDMVCIQTPEYGGGEIRFDGRLIRKDGRFVAPELEGLNPEKLV